MTARGVRPHPLPSGSTSGSTSSAKKKKNKILPPPILFFGKNKNVKKKNKFQNFLFLRKKPQISPPLKIGFFWPKICKKKCFMAKFFFGGEYFFFKKNNFCTPRKTIIGNFRIIFFAPHKNHFGQKQVFRKKFFLETPQKNYWKVFTGTDNGFEKKKNLVPPNRTSGTPELVHWI